MVLNILQHFILLLFIAVSLVVLFRDRKQRFGLVVTDSNGKQLVSGKQGTQTVIGRGLSSDVTIHDNAVSRIQAVVSYFKGDSSLFKMDKYGICDTTYLGSVGENTERFCLNGNSEHIFDFSLPANGRLFAYNYAPIMVAYLFVVLRAIAFYSDYKAFITDAFIGVLPFVLLCIFLLFCLILRADRQPIIECCFAVLLTFYVEATVYTPVVTGNAAAFASEMEKACVGVIVYLLFCLGAKLLVTIDFGKWYVNKLRIICVAVILAIIGINIVFGVEVNGAKNWLNFGGVQVQPSEFVKVLYLIVLICPVGKRFDEIKNMTLICIVTLICALYAIVISDNGVLLQFAVMFVVSVLVQSSMVLSIPKMLIGLPVVGFLGLKVLLVIVNSSATAKSRIVSWFNVESLDDITIKSLLGGLTGSGILSDYTDSGYQAFKAALAIKNGSWFGKGSMDMMFEASQGKPVAGANSDLVTAILVERHGLPVLFLLILVFLVVCIGVVINMRQQNKTQQAFACIAASVVFVTMFLNIGGTYGSLPLTGVVLSCLSDGVSSAVCYGCFFGVMSASNLSRGYLGELRKCSKIGN